MTQGVSLFFRSVSGARYPVSSIVRIDTRWRENGEPEWSEFDHVQVELSNGNVISVYRSEIDRLDDRIEASVAANSGTLLVSIDENPDEFYFQPVLGWVIHKNRIVSPVIAEGVFHNEAGWVVQTADGLVTDWRGNSWPNLEFYRASEMDQNTENEVQK